MLLFLVALSLTTLTVLIHSLGMYASLALVRRFLAEPSRHRWMRTEVLMVSLVGGLLVTHLAEMAIWAMVYWWWAMLPDFETAAYYSSTSYTTVGYGDVVLPSKWRMLGPVEASVGVLMLGWSTAVIVAIVQKVFRDGVKG